MTTEHEKFFKLVHKGATEALSKYLREHPVDVDTLSTGLLRACDEESFELVRLLVESGADVNRRDANGWTPLHWAVATSIDSDCKHKLGRRVDDAPVDIIVYLLWKGADPLTKSNEGKTPADSARRVDSDKLVHLLEIYEKVGEKMDSQR